jgi:hypothetical protein
MDCLEQHSALSRKKRQVLFKKLEPQPSRFQNNAIPRQRLAKVVVGEKPISRDLAELQNSAS